ncbi:DUF859 family phage minor structural protein [Microbacterium sp. LjRoot45]|uniref:DUF859 family phage minor structural protein n=1 Tax=Microbacterium sp. LjRoot45 TaxID=3342329 RepID=UPI003ECE6F3E
MATFKDAINSQYDAELVITLVKQEVTNNRSLVRRTVRNRKDEGSGLWSNTGYPWSLSGGGNESGTYTYDFTEYSVKTIYEDEVWINHSADGTRTVTFSASVSMGGPLFGTGTPSGSVTLPTIPRATQPDVGGAVNAGSVLEIDLPRASSSFTHTLTYSFEGASGTIATGVGSSYDWTVPLSLLNRIPDSVSGSGTITAKTYSGSTLVGTKSVAFTIRASSSIVPTVSTLTVSEAVPEIASAIGAYVQAQTKLSYAISGAAGVYGSTITAYKVTVAGQTLTGQSGTTAALAASGTVNVVATVTDSRGRTATRTVAINVLPWAPPSITLLKVQRCLPDGTLNDDGTSLKFTVAASVSSLVNGTQRNTLKWQARTRQKDTTVWTSTALTTHSGIALSATFVISTYSELLAWDARFEVTDRFTTSAQQAVVSVGAVTLDIGPSGIGVGKRWERGALDVAGDIYSTRLRLSATNDAEPSSTAHAFQIGADTSGNLVIDPNEIMARNNGAVSTLGLNSDGGDIILGGASSSIQILGRINSAHTAYAEAQGLVDITPSAADTPTGVSIVFPVGRFNRAPRLQVTAATTVPGTATGVKGVGYSGTSASGTTVYLTRGSTTTTPVAWHATQMFESSTDG